METTTPMDPSTPGIWRPYGPGNSGAIVRDTPEGPVDPFGRNMRTHPPGSPPLGWPWNLNPLPREWGLRGNYAPSHGWPSGPPKGADSDPDAEMGKGAYMSAVPGAVESTGGGTADEQRAP